jgi:probable addiction module antidote protein
MAKKTRPFDAAEYLDNPEMIAAYLREVFMSGDTGLMLFALRDVARAKGMTALANETGLARESLYRALAEGGNPGLATLNAVIASFGLRLSVQPDNSKH